MRSLAGELDEQQDRELRDWGYLEFDMPTTADKLNALMRLDQRLLRPDLVQILDTTDVNFYSAIDSPGLDELIARFSGQPLVPYSNLSWGEYAPRPQTHFDDQTLSAFNADTVRLGPGIEPGALHASWSTVDTEEGPRRALSLSWGGPGGVHVLMPEDGALPGVGIERFEFADGTVWSMEQMASLVPQAPQPVVAALSEWPALAPGNDPWQASFEAQFNNLIHAMAAFAPPPMASFTPTGDSLAGAVAPVLAANPY